MVEGLRSSNVAVVDAGRVPSRPVPYVLIIPALSLVLGGFIGIAGALLVESTSDRIEAMATIENSLRAPILAVLPMTAGTPLQELSAASFRSFAADSATVTRIPRLER